MNIVFDTSVLIAAFYHPPDIPTFTKDVYDYVIAKHTAYVSDEILKEFRDKCHVKLKMDTGHIQSLESLIKKRVQVKAMKHVKYETEVPEKLKQRDAKDVHVVQLALGIRADVILTWDKDMLDLKRVGKLKIRSPRTFLDEFIA